MAAHPGEYEFTSARGDETVSPPRAHGRWILRQRRSRAYIAAGEWNLSKEMRRQHLRSYASPPKGTPIFWYRSGYETVEWDVKLPSDIEIEMTVWEKFDYDAYLAAEAAA